MSRTLIALDFDGCLDRNADMWNAIIAMLRKSGYLPVVVTMRFKTEQVTSIDAPVIYTGRKAKKPFTISIGLDITIWLDDNPHFVLIDAYEHDPEHWNNKVSKNLFDRPEYEEKRTTKEEVDFLLSSFSQE